MKGLERPIEKAESIGNGLNEMKKTSPFRSDKPLFSHQSSRRPSFDLRAELAQEAEEAAATQSSTMMSLAAMDNERKELMVRLNPLITSCHTQHILSSCFQHPLTHLPSPLPLHSDTRCCENLGKLQSISLTNRLNHGTSFDSY